MILEIMTTKEIAGLDDFDMRTLPKDLKEYCKVKWVSVESLKLRLRKETNQPFNDIDFPTFASRIKEIIDELENKEVHIR